MTRDYIGHWIIGITCALVWFWGAKVDIPPSAINLAAWIVPGLLAHAIGRTSITTDQAPVAKSAPTAVPAIPPAPTIPPEPQA